MFTPAWQWSPVGSPQDEFLHSWLPEVALLGGRGTRKTAHLVAADAISALLLHRGGVGYLTEQTNTQVEDILLPFYREFLNPDLYEIRGGQGARDVHWRETGAITRLRSRQATSRHRDPPFRGPNAPRGIGHDEIAIDEDPASETRDPILISMAMLRGGGERLAHPCKPLRYCTTPKKNFFYDYMHGLGIAENNKVVQRSKDGLAIAFYSRTQDVDPALYSRLLQRYSAEFAAQELDAQWIEAHGRIWTTFNFDGLDNELPLWPSSNIHRAVGFNPTLPYVLGVDLGATASAWNLAQPYDAIDQLGRRVHHGTVLVTVAEWTPARVSPVMILDEIRRYAGGAAPAEIWIGHDYKTPGGAESTTPHMAFQQIGWGGAIRTHVGRHTFSKDAQGMAAQAAICNAVGERRYAVSHKIERYHEDGRGVLEMLRADTWPERGTDVFEKSKSMGKKNYEDSRDAMLYLLAGIFPPPAAHTTKPQAVR